MMHGTKHEVLASQGFREEHRAKTHSSNTLERLNG